ncbi:Ig-like domain-containing protein [Psychrobium sp. 1_MG-2023]|uniref:Ig-like domain-containing protein n=1 Tax=Psychrobium sp. 1_MG-2023 TaxID=3062624 RepID=UPI002735924A|nr:Ig-like domain-containing protein [Psychrobium sp. 1_MG-2023]MDP2560626.1 Ig-like domain-containing protein [Psychrobium sp. 1_MG-2023]
MNNLNKIKAVFTILTSLSIALSSHSFAVELNDKCVINILNRTIQVASNGGWSLPNVPSNQGAVKARATCINEDGSTSSGQSGYFNLITNGITPVGDIMFAEQEPVPADLSFFSSNQITLTSLGQNFQLQVTATYPDGLTDDVTNSGSGINYTSSNTGVVSVNANGLLTATGSGQSLISADKDGLIATRLVRISFTGDQDGDGLPDDYETSNGLDPNDPADAFEDIDGDGLSALDEYNAGTDLTKADSDDDGIKDGEEIIEGDDGFITNPLLSDSDGDGLSDSVEITTGSDPSDNSSNNFEDAIVSISATPTNVVMTFNGIDSEVSTQLTVMATILDGSQLDVTAKGNGTAYSSSDLSIVSFGLSDGEIFGGAEGNATVTVSLFDLSLDIPVTVESFQPVGIASLTFTGNGHDTDVQGDYVYIAAGAGGLHIVNTSVKETPELVATQAITGSAVDVKVVGMTAYVAAGASGIDIINVSNPLEPALISNIKTAGNAVDLAVQNGLLFVANGSGGMEIIDVNDNTTPFSLAKLEGLGNVIGIDAQNDRAVIASSSSIIIADITDPSSPMRLGSINIGNVRAVVMDGDYAYVACYTCGYKVVDISDPLKPSIVGSDSRFYPSDVELTNGLAFFSDILFVNAVPYVNIFDPLNSIFQGVIDIREFGDRDAVGLSLDAAFAYSTGSNKLYISQYRVLDDNQGIAPTVEIIAPLDGGVVVENSRVLVRVEASDDVAVAAVNFTVNGTLLLTDTTRPYEAPVLVPDDSDTLNILVEAVDFGNNIENQVTLLSIEPDGDNDGLGDNEEVFTWFTDPEDPDSDNDGLPDGDEINIGTDPNDSDSDDDERTDGAEVAAGTDPLNPDITAPLVSLVDPLNEALDICENQSITVTFNEGVLRNSITADSLMLLKDGATATDGSLSLISSNTEILFSPTGLLQDNSDYTIKVAGVKDEAGNVLATEFTSTFTTGNCVDLERPTVIDISPLNGSTEIPVNSLVTVILNEPIDPTTVTEDTMYVIDQSSGQRIGGVLQVADNKSAITFTPNVPFLVGRRHYVYITTGILDLFGNALIGTSRYFDTSFEPDGTGPEIISTTIDDGATDLPINAKLAVLFDEPINALYLQQIQLQTALGVQIAVTRDISSDRRRVILSPITNLDPNEDFVFLIDGVQDSSGNLLANSYQVSFTTGEESDTTTGSDSIWSIPVNNTQDVPLNPILSVTLSEPIDPTTLNSNSLYLWDNSTGLRISATRTISEDGTTLTLVPDDLLRENRRYYFYVGYSPYFTDFAGNIVAQNRYRYFTTGYAEDSTAPEVSSLNMLDGNTIMPINGKVIITLDQPISDACSLADSIQLMTGETPTPVTASLANDRRTITIMGEEPFDTETTYQLSVAGLCDYAGNALSEFTMSFTTTDVETNDTTGPSLVSITPAHTATDVSVTTTVVMEYDENIDIRSMPPITGAGITLPGDYVVDGSTITFTPSINLLGETRYTAGLYYNVADLAGNTRYGGTKYFDTQATTDIITPTVQVMSPNNGAMDTNPSQPIVLTFDEPMNIGTLISNNIAIYSNGSIINSSIFRSADGRQVTLTASLPHSSLISVVMTDAVTDLSGNAIAPFVSSFTTGVFDTDVTRPSIIRQVPANGSGGWLNMSDVYFYTNDVMDSSTLEESFHLAENGVLVDVDISLVGDGRTIKVSKATNFTEGALVQVYWNNNLMDDSGNPVHAYNGYFNMGVSIDNIGDRAYPTAYYPNNGSRGTPLNPVLLTRFTEEIDESSLTDATVTLSDVTGGWIELPITTSLDSTGKVIKVTPVEPLVADNQYYLWFGVDILDTDGDNIASDYATYFHTDADSELDDRQPIVEVMSPPVGEDAVGINTLFSVRYDEQMNPISFDYQLAVNPQFSETNKVVKYELPAPLAPLAEHTEPAPLMVDLAGNGIVPQSTTFTTANGPDFIAPTVLDTAISQNQQDVALNPVFEWRFSEPIDPNSATSSGIYIWDSVTGLNVPSTFELSANGKHLIVIPTEPLLVLRRYYQYAYGMRDLSGNNLGNHYRYFTTGTESDATAPSIITTTINDGETGISTNVRLNVQFDEPLNPLNLSGVSLQNAAGEEVGVNINLIRGRTTINIVPKQLLSSMSDYQLRINGMRDTSGNTQEGELVINFSSGDSVDLIKGAITRWSIPVNNTQNVPLNPLLEVTFNERIDSTTVDKNSFYLWNNTTGLNVPGTWLLSNDGLTLQFIPEQPLESNTRHYLYVGYSPYLTDLSGNLVAQNNYRYFTTGTTEDDAAPAVSATNFLDGNSMVPVNGRVLLTLNEPLSDSCNLTNGVSVASGAVNHDFNAVLDSDRKTIIITSVSGFDVSTAYTVTLDGICDYAGNNITPYSINFTTSASTDPDASGPSLVSISPAHTATDVVTSLDQIVMVYDEAVDVRSAPPVKGGGITIPGDYVVTNDTITFNPSINLLGSTRYTVELYYNVPDLAGNTRWGSTKYFETAVAADTVAPTITAISPASDATDTSPTQSIVINFSEPMAAGSLVRNNIALFHNGAVINPTIFRSTDGQQLTLTASLPQNALISVVLNDGVTDLSGNSLTPYVSSFTTGIIDNDNARPRIISQVPSNGSTGWTDLDAITLYSSEPLDSTSLDNGLTIEEDGVLTEASLSLSGDNRVMTITKEGGFTPGKRTTFYLNTNITDQSDNPLHNYSGSIVMADISDGTGSRPYPTAYYPNSGSRGTPLNPILLTSFTEEIDASSLSSTTVTLSDVTNDWAALSVSISLDASGKIIQVTPDEELVPENQYYLWFSVDILDTDGDNLASNYATYFNTFADSAVDDSQPSVSAMSPPSGEDGVGINAQFSVRFDEPVNSLSFDVATNNKVNVQFSEDNTVVKYNHRTPLAPSTEITETIDAVTDLAGNIVIPSSATFNTASGPDFINPTVIDTALFNNQQNVPTTPQIEWIFSEPIDFVSATNSGIYIWNNNTGENVGSSWELSPDGKRLTVVPDEALESGSRHYTYAYSMRDLSGNNLGNHYRYFTVGFDEDTLGPLVQSSTVFDGQTNVPTNVKLKVRYNEILNPIRMPFVSLKDSADQVIPVNVSLTRGRTLLNITPKQLLTPNTSYTLDVSGVEDISGNAQETDLALTFVTGETVDLATSGIKTWSIPVNNTQNVPLNPLLEVTFNERVDRTTVDENSFRLWNNTTGLNIAGTWALSADGLRLGFSPAEALDENTRHYLYVGYSPYLTDMAGNLIAQNNYRYFTTGDTTDTTNPMINKTSIADGNTTMPVNGQIVLVMDQPLSDACLYSDNIVLKTGGANVDINIALASDRKTITITGKENFTVDTLYDLSVITLCDYAGNELTGDVLSFTTIASDIEDTSGPTLVSITPAHTASDVAITSTVVIEYQEPVDMRSAPAIKAGSVVVEGTYSVVGNTITFTPAEDLANGTTYTVELYRNVPDFTGRTVYGGTKTFTTVE